MAEVVRVRLGDETFSLRTDRDPRLLEAAAALVDGKLAELRAGGAPSAKAAALLAALSLADELLEARRDKGLLRDGVDTALAGLLGRLDGLDAAIDALDDGVGGRQ
mgnify:CR=1|jgi:cell division protein ZapA (FtsZ GTPase activity inhibitor)